MSLIHHRIRDGKKVYRLWSSIAGGYLTDDLTYEEMVDELRLEAVRSALLACRGTEFERRMERAHRTGTSDAFSTRNATALDGPWEREENDDEEGDGQ